MKILSMRPPAAILLTSLIPLSSHALNITGFSSGFFHSPTPGRDPANPYYYRGPSYSGEGTDSISWGVPRAGDPAGPIVRIVDEEGRRYSDLHGNFATWEDGSIQQFPVGSSGVQVTPLEEAAQYFNNLTFAPTLIDHDTQNGPFTLGTLYYRNSSSILGSEITGISLFVEVFGDDPGIYYELPLNIAIAASPNTGNPVSDADYIYFPDYPTFGSFRVKEGETTAVQLLAEFGSLHFRGFGEVLDPSKGYLSLSLEPSAPVPDSSSGIFVMSLMALFGLQKGIERRRNGAEATSNCVPRSGAAGAL
jgi:hypothetical protein